MSIAVLLLLIGASFGGSLSTVVAGRLPLAFLLAAVCLVLTLVCWRTYGWRAKHLDDLLEAFEDMPIPMAVYDSNERLILSNKLYRSHHPESRIDLTNPRLRPSYSDLAAGNDSLLYARQVAQAQIIENVAKGASPDGTLVEVEFPRIGWLRVGKRRLSRGGNVRVAIDVNELKTRERDLECAVERALAADASKLQFLATVTHELRTPLNGVIGMSAVLLASAVDTKVRSNVETIKASGEHLLAVVDQLLDYARMTNHTVDLEEEEFDLVQLVEDVVNEARFSPQAEDINIKYELADKLPSTWIGARMGLRQVLTNLVGNAVKFTNRGFVKIEVDHRGNELVVAVEDSGVGISEADLAKVFLPFEKIRSTQNTQIGGTGLGLAITEELVAGMSGTISVRSKVGIGTQFEFSVPMVPGDHAGQASKYRRDKHRHLALPRAS